MEGKAFICGIGMGLIGCGEVALPPSEVPQKPSAIKTEEGGLRDTSRIPQDVTPEEIIGSCVQNINILEDLQKTKLSPTTDPQSQNCEAIRERAAVAVKVIVNCGGVVLYPEAVRAISKEVGDSQTMVKRVWSKFSADGLNELTSLYQIDQGDPACLSPIARGEIMKVASPIATAVEEELDHIEREEEKGRIRP